VRLGGGRAASAGRAGTWGRLAAIGVGVFAVGLGVPLLFSEPIADQAVVADGAGGGVALGDTTSPEGTSEDGAAPEATSTGPADEPAVASQGAAAGPAAQAATTPAPGAAPLRATDRGVTAEVVKVGFLILQVGQVEQIGFAVGASVDEQRAAWKAFVDEVNRNGGIVGRRIEPVFAQYDVLDYDTLRAACLALVQDGDVFAVLDGGGTYFGPAQLCVTEEHQTPLLVVGATGVTDEYLGRSGGRLYSLYMRASRSMRTFAEEVHRAGHLRGRTLGLLGDARNRAELDVLVDELARRGYRLAHRTLFDEDTGTASAQVPVEVQEMRRKGVDAVVLAGNVVAETQFVQAADAQGFRPRYFATDWANNSQDAAHQNQPPSFDGALAVTVRRSGEHLVGRPERPVETRCRELYERATGQRLQRGAINTSLYTLMCSTLDVFVAGARNTGPELTRSRLAGGMAAIGPVVLSQMGDGSFSPGKPDAGEQVRWNRWAADCRCWKPAGEFHRAPF